MNWQWNGPPHFVNELLVEQLPKARQGGLVMTNGLAVIIKLYRPGIDKGKGVGIMVLCAHDFHTLLYMRAKATYCDV